MQGDVGIFRSVFADVGGWHVTHRLLILSARSDKLVDVDGLVVQINLRHVIHVVAQLRLEQIMGNHRVEHLTFEFYSIVGEHLKVVLHVLPDFENMLAFVHRSENFEYLHCLLTVFGNRHIKCFERLDGEAQTDQFGRNRVC